MKKNNKNQATQLSIVCKTYSGDVATFKRLYRSFVKFNKDNIKMYISVPKDEVDLFKSIVIDKSKVISDESYASEYFTKEEHWGLSRGYINQEICKLSFWENNFSKNCLFVDSDTYFIRDFYLSDFMFDGVTPYSVLVMDKDLNTEYFYRDFGEFRSSLIKIIFDRVGLKDRRMLTCHGMTIINSRVMQNFKTEFMLKNKLSYSDLIQISPYEFTWYNAWLQKSQIINVVGVEPFFKTFHMRAEYLFSRYRLITQEKLSRQYVGIVLNSNWRYRKPPRVYKDPGKLTRAVYNIIERVG